MSIFPTFSDFLKPPSPGILPDPHNLLVHAGVGEGGYANVSAATYRDQPVAVKRYETDVPESSIQRETEVMTMLKGEFHVVQFLGRYIDTQGRNCLVMELAFNLSLKTLLETTNLEFSHNLKVRIAKDVCFSLQCLHNNGIAHEDIKTDNVLLDFGLRAKLCDFGTAKFQGEEFSDKLTGTSSYRAPERSEAKPGEPYDRQRSDIYSLGKVLQEIFGEIPIVKLCLAKHPNERPVDCAAVLEDLPDLNPREDLDYADFRTISVHSLGEADRINLAYYWTEAFDPDSEDPAVRRGRKLFYQGAYEGAMAIFMNSEDAVADVFLGIMRFHGYGCEKDIHSALALFEGCCLKDEIQERHLTLSLVEYYIARIRTLQEEKEGMEGLFKVSNTGNAFAQVELSNAYCTSVNSLSRGTLAPLWHSSKKNILDFLLKAAKSGYAHAQAMLTVFYIVHNGKPNIPSKERHYLDKSIEAGSLVGKILSDFVNGALDKSKLMESKNGALLEFVGDLHALTSGHIQAFECYSMAAKCGRASSLWARAHILQSQNMLLDCAKSDLQWLIGRGFNSLANDDCYFFRMPRHLATVEHELAAILVREGREEDALNLVISSSDTSDKAMASLFALCNKGGEIWHDVLRNKRQNMSKEAVMRIGARYSLSPSASGHNQRAQEWLREAVKMGNMEALVELATVVRRGGNTELALEYNQLGADAGDPVAMLQLAVNMKKEGTKEERRKWLERAAAKREPLAMLELATMRRHDGDTEGATELLKGALMHGLERASTTLAFVHASEGRREESQYWFQRAMKNVEAEAVIYELGSGYEDEDVWELVAKSANLKLDSTSLFNMGMLHAGKQDPRMGPSKQAYDFFCLAAEKHHLHAAVLCLRYCHVWGDAEGVSKWQQHLQNRGSYSGSEAPDPVVAHWKALLQHSSQPSQR